VPARPPARSAETDNLSPQALRAYTIERAKALGIDPDFAAKVFQGESGFRANAKGDDNSSFGVAQLHYGNTSERYPRPGLGDVFTRETGLDARDPNNAKAVIDWSLKHASENGWNAWTVARNLQAGGDKSPVDRAIETSSRYTQGPVEKIGAKLGIPEMMRDERVFVPLLAGIGSMLASDKPRFSQALGEGLAGAAGAYGAVRGQTQDIANKQANERLTNVQAAGASILKDGTGRPYGVLVFDPKTGGMRQMDFGEAYRRREELNLLPETTERIRQLQMDSDSGAGVSPRPGTGSSTSSNTGTGTVSGTGATTGSTTSPRTEARPPAVDPAAVEPTGTPPRRPEASGPIPVARIFSPNDSDIARINAESQKMIGQDLTKIPDDYTRAVEQSRTALDQRPLLFQFANAYSGLPDKGPMTPSAVTPVVRNVGEIAQGIFKTFGMTGPLNQADIDRAVAIDKLTSQMKAQASEQTGQRSYSALQELGTLAPTIGTPKGGGAKNLAAIIVANQSKIDEDLFAKGLLDRADEANKTNARYTGQVIRELFTNRFSSKQEQERDSIAKMFTENFTLGGKPVLEPGTKRPVKWMNWLSDPKNAESLSRREQVEIEKRFGEGILRYFPGVRR
jgi:hypothetical protein